MEWPLLLMLALCCSLVAAYSNTVGLCPSTCACSLDIRGRHQVLCASGGMVDPLPMTSMDRSTEVLQITAPEGKYNSLTIGPIFRDLEKLERLYITRSKVPAIGAHSFWGLKNLRILDLTNNRIRHLLAEHFRGLVELHELYLDDNLIESMPSNTFIHMPELQVLSLSKNNLKELVPRVFLKLGKLNSLDMSGNPLMDLNPEVFKDIQELKVFKCRSCGLSNMNNQVYHILPWLEQLDLGLNQFKFLGPDEFTELKKLQRLHIDGNQLSVVLDKVFGASTPNLHFLSMAHNRISRITSNAFLNATTLRELDIGYNKLDRLDPVILSPIGESLRGLSLSGNQLSTADLKHALQSVLKLRELSLADMNIHDLPLGIFVFHEHLRTLNLSRNQFSHLPAQILAPIMRLRELDLSGNRFRGLDERLVSRLEKDYGSSSSGVEVMAVTSRSDAGVAVKLQGNPWACDRCHIGPILSWISRHIKDQADYVCSPDISPFSLACLRCKTPYSLSGRRLYTLKVSELTWCGTGGLAGYGDDETALSADMMGEEGIPRLGLFAAASVAAIAVLLLLLAVSAAAIAYNRHAAQYYTHEEDRVHSNSEREAIFENPAVTMDENGDLRFAPLIMSGCYPDSNLTTKPGGKKKKIKFVTIATIDEITKDPDLNSQTNLTNGS